MPVGFLMYDSTTARYNVCFTDNMPDHDEVTAVKNVVHDHPGIHWADIFAEGEAGHLRISVAFILERQTGSEEVMAALLDKLQPSLRCTLTRLILRVQLRSCGVHGRFLDEPSWVAAPYLAPPASFEQALLANLRKTSSMAVDFAKARFDPSKQLLEWVMQACWALQTHPQHIEFAVLSGNGLELCADCMLAAPHTN